MRSLVIVALALCAFSSQVHAGCTCQCVGGQMQPLCSRPSIYRAVLHGDMRPGRAFNRPNQSAEYPATGHNILPTGPGLRSVRKLPLATGLPIILNSALMTSP